MDTVSDPTVPAILVVDDDPVVRLVAAQTLREAGFASDEAADGETALGLFDPGRHVLVLLDVNMDGMDGFQVCRALRERPGAEHVPVIMLTGLHDTDSIDLAYLSGATDFITKPINWTLLKHRVRYALRVSHTLEDLARSERRLATAQRIARLAGWVWDPAQDVFGLSAEYRQLLGIADRPLVWSSYNFLARVDPHDRERVQAALEAAAQGRAYTLTYRVRDEEGQTLTLYEQTQAVKNAAGEVARVEGIAQDVTDQALAQERIRYLAYHDSLTGLANRQFFREALPLALARGRRAGRRSALLYIDLDRLKRVNDTLGHAVGDQMLNALSARLKAGVRAGDMAGRAAEGGEEVEGIEGGLVARLGGDEFILLLADLDSAADAVKVAERLLASLAEPVRLERHELRMTASIGIAVCPDHGEQADALVRHADLAMYAAKEQGRNCCVMFDEGMRELAATRAALERDLSLALEADGLELHYQPKVDATTSRMVSAEALLRWRHPERGAVSPAEFIPIAEESGLIVPLGEWVIRQAARQMRAWREAGLPLVPVSVNLASPSFHHHGLPEVIRSALEHNGLGAELLRLELTESILMEELDATRSILPLLKGMGVSLSIDDFGAGYSSLAYLRQFPIDELKIDRQFVADVTEDAGDASITAAIIALAQQLGLDVVAEGVETAGQKEFLLERGCRVMQGFLFAAPMPAAAFAELLGHGVLPGTGGRPASGIPFFPAAA